MGGHQVTGTGTGDDGYDEEGYDESQRAEILEVTRDGPSDGTIITDLDPDLGDEDNDEAMDDLDMEDGEVAEEDASVTVAKEDMDEDDVQDEFDDGTEDDDELDDGEDAALRP